MKKINLLISIMLFAQGALACVTNSSGQSICVDDKVFMNDLFSWGAKVLAVNPNSQSVTVKSLRNLDQYRFSRDELALTSDCLLSICPGDKVFMGSKYSRGATVEAINFSQKTAVVKSINNQDLFVESIVTLDLSEMSSRFSEQQRYQNQYPPVVQPRNNNIEDFIVDSLIDLFITPEVETCNVVNSSGTVIGSNIVKSEFILAAQQYAIDENSCVIGNTTGETRSHFVIGKDGYILETNLSENEASSVRNNNGYSRCKRATCQ